MQERRGKGTDGLRGYSWASQNMVSWGSYRLYGIVWSPCTGATITSYNQPHEKQSIIKRAETTYEGVPDTSFGIDVRNHTPPAPHKGVDPFTLPFHFRAESGFTSTRGRKYFQRCPGIFFICGKWESRRARGIADDDVRPEPFDSERWNILWGPVAAIEVVRNFVGRDVSGLGVVRVYGFK